MKLIPITAAYTLIPERRFKRSVDLQMKRMIMNKFMKPLRYLLSCLSRNPKETAYYKLVLKENMRHAFKGIYPTAKIDYTRLIVSKGELPPAPGLTVSSPNPGQLLFQWRDNSGTRRALESDYLFVALFNWDSRKWLFEIDAAERSNCHLEMEANGFQGKLVHVYAGFVSADSGLVSSSVYLGEMEVMGIVDSLRA